MDVSQCNMQNRCRAGAAPIKAYVAIKHTTALATRVREWRTCRAHFLTAFVSRCLCFWRYSRRLPLVKYSVMRLMQWLSVSCQHL